MLNKKDQQPTDEGIGAIDSGARGGPREVQRRRTRQAIIDSAIKIFALAGFDGADMRTIATRAGVNYGLLHYHFSSKLRLWKACVDHLNDLAAKAPLHDDDGTLLDWATFEGHEVQFMNAVIRNYVNFAALHPEWAQILMDATRSSGARLDYVVDNYQRPRSQAIQDLFRRLQALGHVPAISPLIMQYLLWGMAHTLFTMAAEVKRKVGIDPTKDRQLIEEQVRAIRTLLFGSRYWQAAKPRKQRK